MTREEAIKEAYGIPVTKAQHEALQFLIPELAESEDERIRKILINIVKGACSKYGIKHICDEISEEKLLDYLEKQKECSFSDFPKSCDDCPKEIQAAIDKEFGIDGRDDNDNPLNGYGDWKKGMVLNGPAIWGLVKLGIELQKEDNPINECNTHEPTLDEARKWNEAYEKGYSLGYENGRNGQKPEEFSEDERILNAVITHISIYEGDFTTVGVTRLEMLDWLEKLKKQKEQKPAECLNPEKDCWYVCIKDFYCGGKKQSSKGDLVQAKGGMYMMGREDISEWFRKAYYDEIKPAEWSEEDEAMLKEIISFFKDGSVKLQHDLDLYAGFLEKRLKSIRPQPNKLHIKKGHWYMCIVDKPEYGWTKGKVYQSPEDNRIETNYKGSLTNWPDSEPWFRPATRSEIQDSQLSWKPSEEQMEALKNAAYGISINGDGPMLRSIYNDLKKLM